MLDQQEKSSWDETVASFSEEQRACDETPSIPAPQASKTRALEALTIYPISSQVTACLQRRDVYALALSCRAIFHSLNIQDPVSHRSIISRCVQKCHGPYMWGLPEHVTAPSPGEHEKLVREGAEMDVRACVRKNCRNDVCQSEDDNYYDFAAYRNSYRFEAADPIVCKNGERTVYYYSCWDCEEMAEPPYKGMFICRWCNGRLPYTELIPWDIIPYSKQSCRVRPDYSTGGGWGKRPGGDVGGAMLDGGGR
ncbi:hypothetical protein C7212DRAFT_343910 [Tuber magnatum]|uniref:Uncharacterized protein n=1 Tax=Tuber magnatum TaxID=42249 RepID=A0A317SR06_9PEZI|nr:hypothetical protein C7212DRAFT_343910 [Tuber magnatum]